MLCHGDDAKIHIKHFLKNLIFHIVEYDVCLFIVIDAWFLPTLALHYINK